jgi:hypothetical protein
MSDADDAAARPRGARMSDADADAYDLDRELEAVERFIAAVQAGDIGTSEAMAAYRNRFRPAIDRLRAELDRFRALLEESGEPAPSEPAVDPAAPAAEPRAPGLFDAPPDAPGDERDPGGG